VKRAGNRAINAVAIAGNTGNTGLAGNSGDTGNAGTDTVVIPVLPGIARIASYCPFNQPSLTTSLLFPGVFSLRYVRQSLVRSPSSATAIIMTDAAVAKSLLSRRSS